VITRKGGEIKTGALRDASGRYCTMAAVWQWPEDFARPQSLSRSTGLRRGRLRLAVDFREVRRKLLVIGGRSQ